VRIRRTCLLALLLGMGVAVACSDSSETAGTASASTQAPAASPASAPAKAAAKPAARRDRPLPAFQGVTLDDRSLSLGSLVGKRFLLFLFNPTVADADMVADGVAGIADERAEHNFEIIGVSMGGSREQAKEFLRTRGLDFATIHDSQASLANRLGLRSPVAMLMVDAEGYVVGGAGAFSDEGKEPSKAVEQMLREWLRLPADGAPARASLGERPEAPLFSAERLEGGEPFELASLRGEPAVLVFFLHTCPHCHKALEFFKEALASLPEDKRPALVGVSILNRTIAVRDRLKEDGLDYFPVVMDADASIREAYGALASVPVVFLIDAEGRIVMRRDGWLEERDPPLVRMHLARLAGQPVPMLLHKTGSSGNEFCGVCHESEAGTWELTNHATAFDTLVRHGSERDGECVGCHVVGFEQPGGYALDGTNPHLEDVGCEACHGRGGPHLSPEYVSKDSYESVCVGCHNPEHSLGFEYASFLPRVSHQENLQFAGLSLDEKRAILAERRRPRKDILPTSAEYVGSAACQSCHPAEHETWAGQPHARSLASLEAKGEAANTDCQACHTTAPGKPGGFPLGSVPSEHPDLASVGCESCHGPGGEHVKPESRKIGSIVSLGDKCDSCVILQICGSCHDDANDPGFEFEVQDKIDRQRHGTIEAGTGAPKDASAFLPEAGSGAENALLEHAFRSSDPGRG